MDVESVTSTSIISGESDTQKRPYHTLIRDLNDEKLQDLRTIFKEKKRGDEDTSYMDVGLNKKEFVEAINKVYGNGSSFEAEAIAMFKDVDREEKCAMTWNDFLDFMAKLLEPRYTRLMEFGRPEYASPPHVKRDSIAKIVLLETETYFCYAVISKFGLVGLYDGNMDFLTSYSTIMAKEDVHRSDAERRRRNRWITDAIFVADVMMMIVVNTSRSMTVYDASGLKHIPVWLILGFPDIIQTLAWTESFQNAKKKLCLGCDNGKVLIMTFHKGKDRFFRKKHNDKLTVFYYRELSKEKEYVTLRNLGRVHSETVNDIDYLTNNIVVSCSRDCRISAFIKETNSKQPPYIFKMRRGANCFAISNRLKIMITGSDDGTIRVWNVVVPAKPMSVLNVHESGIIDVAIMEGIEAFLSCSRDGVLILWDLKEHVCLQSLRLKFPCFEVMGKTVEWGTKSIYPGPRRKGGIEENGSCDNWERSHVIVICCNYFAKIELRYLDGKKRNFEEAVLPPPPLQNSFLIPKDWKICDEEEREEHHSEEISSDHVDMERLRFITDKNILEEVGKTNDINFKIAQTESKKLQMKWSVEKNAPYLALDLFEMKEISLSPDLPVPNVKKLKNLVDRTRKMLTDAATRSIIFSEQSSSSKSPRSSRSSIVEFD